MRLTLRELRQVIREAAEGNVDLLAKRVIDEGDLEALQVLVDTLQEQGDPRGNALLSSYDDERMQALLSFLPGKAYKAFRGPDGGIQFKFRTFQVKTTNTGAFRVIFEKDLVHKVSNQFIDLELINDPNNEFPLKVGGIFGMPETFSYVTRLVKWDGSWFGLDGKGNIVEEAADLESDTQDMRNAQRWKTELVKALPSLNATYDDIVPKVSRLLSLVNEIPKLFPETPRD